MARAKRQAFVHLAIGLMVVVLLGICPLVEHPFRWMNFIAFGGLALQMAAAVLFLWQAHRLGQQYRDAVCAPSSKS